jgi:hypothetical protein
VMFEELTLKIYTYCLVQCPICSILECNQSKVGHHFNNPEKDDHKGTRNCDGFCWNEWPILSTLPKVMVASGVYQKS